MEREVIQGILIPFIGTSLGASCVFFMKNTLNTIVKKSLNGFASGVMMAASIWSLIIPSIEQSEHLGKLAFLPTTIGFLLGIGFLLVLDLIIPHLHINSTKSEGVKSNLKRTTMLVLAVTLHNIPEGMAIGIVFAGYLTGNTTITIMSAIVLSIGIAIQNFPEGAIISMPLKAEGVTKPKSFLYGVLSGIVEPIGAIITILCASFLVPVLPYLLSFASGAMIYVIIEELVPEMSQEPHSNMGTISFALGFALMMVLDVTLG